MTLRAIYIQGELTAFLPDINSAVTADGLLASAAVASRPDHEPSSGPAGKVYAPNEVRQMNGLPPQ